MLFDSVMTISFFPFSSAAHRNTRGLQHVVEMTLDIIILLDAYD